MFFIFFIVHTGQNPKFACPAVGRVVFRLFDLDKNKVSYFSWGYLSQWKQKLNEYVGERAYLTWYSSVGSSSATPIYLTKAEAAAAHKKALTESDSTDDAIHFFTVNAESIVAHSLESFMFINFGTKPVPSASSRNAAEVFKNLKVDVLQQSFSHLLSKSGHESLDWLKSNIFIRYREWSIKNTSLIAPIASLSQGSGSGKSKLATEAINDGPGFYIVFRDDSPNVTGYPIQNDISKELVRLIRSADNPGNCENEPCSSTIGSVLMFLASIITAYIREWLARSTRLRREHPRDSIAIAVRSACAEIGHMFDFNDKIRIQPAVNLCKDFI